MSALRVLAALALLLASALAVAQTLAPEQTLIAGNGTEPATLDPHKAEGVSDANILRDLYEGLTSVSPTGDVIPGAASSCLYLGYLGITHSTKRQ